MGHGAPAARPLRLRPRRHGGGLRARARSARPRAHARLAQPEPRLGCGRAVLAPAARRDPARPHPDRDAPLPRPHPGVGRRQRGDRRPGTPARHRLAAGHRAGVHPAGLPLRPPGDPGARLVYNDYGTSGRASQARARCWGSCGGWSPRGCPSTRRAAARMSTRGRSGVRRDAAPLRGDRPGRRAHRGRRAAAGRRRRPGAPGRRLPAHRGRLPGRPPLPRHRLLGPRRPRLVDPGGLRGQGDATLFDERLEPKPAYDAVRRALRGG